MFGCCHKYRVPNLSHSLLEMHINAGARERARTCNKYTLNGNNGFLFFFIFRKFIFFSLHSCVFGAKDKWKRFQHIHTQTLCEFISYTIRFCCIVFEGIFFFSFLLSLNVFVHKTDFRHLLFFSILVPFCLLFFFLISILLLLMVWWLPLPFEIFALYEG